MKELQEVVDYYAVICSLDRQRVIELLLTIMSDIGIDGEKLDYYINNNLTKAEKEEGNRC